MTATYDYALVGGGLQNALMTLALRARQPDCRIALIEQNSRLGGNHTWCFHSGDVSFASHDWIEPLVSHRWPGYMVRFDDFERRFDRPYAAITSEQLHRVLVEAFGSGSEILLGAEATQVGEDHVELANGTELRAKVVIDARGPRVSTNGRAATQGYQKFVGLELELAEPHECELPMLMDATVHQHDGFRFMYMLPFTPRRLLVEDTFFANGPELDRDKCRKHVLDYAERAGMRVARSVREEEGVLPMPWREQPQSTRRSPLVAGYGGGFFHPATGYSFPVAARLAEFVASCEPDRLFEKGLASLVRMHRRQAAFCHRLNALLFQWFPPARRRHVFERFYGLPVETIERFFALRMNRIDQGRLLLGRPPRGMSVRYRLTKEAQP